MRQNYWADLLGGFILILRTHLKKEKSVFVGFDPGGKFAFGWCVLAASEGLSSCSVETGTCSNAADALAAVFEATDIVPNAIGIDAPMYWVSAGDRDSDRSVRRRVIGNGGYSGTVSHVNALRGACLAQGIIVGKLARDIWPKIPITESHPKALLRVYPRANRFATQFEFPNDHERDAAIGAYAAWSWHNLADEWSDLRGSEKNVVELISEPHPAYWFPKAAA